MVIHSTGIKYNKKQWSFDEQDLRLRAQNDGEKLLETRTNIAMVGEVSQVTVRQSDGKYLYCYNLSHAVQ